MKRFIIALAITASAFVLGAADTGFEPVPLVKGILFVSEMKDLNLDEGAPAIAGVQVKGLPLLRSAGFKKVVQPYLGRRLERETMLALQRDVVFYYRNIGHPVVDVAYPPQEVKNGVLQVLVVEGKLGQKPVQSSRYSYSATNFWVPETKGWTSAKYLQDNIRIRPGEVIDESKLRRDLDWLNRNPLREVNAFFTPNPKKVGESDVVVKSHEWNRPIQGTVGYEDSGTRITDLNRITAGFGWGKAFGLNDHFLNYQFMADPALKHLRAHVAGYSLPLPWRHNLRFSGYYLEAEGNVDTDLVLKGQSYMAGVRYEVPLPYILKYQHEISLGVEYKSSDNSLAFSSSPVGVNTPTEIFQIGLGYTGGVRDRFGATSIGGQLYYSPGDVLEKNTDEYFNKARYDAKADYLYARLQARRETTLPLGFSWVLNATVQFANGNLLPTEQLGVGGYTTVRGYDERQVNSDEGWIISNELRTPAFSPLKDWCKWGWADDKLQFLGFFDYGVGRNVHLQPLEPSSKTLSSVGCGLRYSARKNLELRFDYGWQLRDLGENGPPVHSRGHLAATFKF